MQTGFTSRLSAMVSIVPMLVAGSIAKPAGEVNLTGLPTYPNLTGVFMDPRLRTDTLGRWCAHLSANTSDAMESVAAWYRKVWTGASETDLRHDDLYRGYDTLEGVKLAIGVDSVAVYKVSPRAPTSIELSRCSPVR